MPSRSNDGDSFLVQHNGKMYIFRLYGVDCPETDLSLPDRVFSQAEEFAATASAIVEWGRLATQKTERILSSPFRVVTRWDNALGRSKLPRHYAYILPGRGGDLAATLLSEGLARVRGSNPVPPPGFPRVGTKSEYQQLQSQAVAADRGMWGDNRPRGADPMSVEQGGGI